MSHEISRNTDEDIRNTSRTVGRFAGTLMFAVGMVMTYNYTNVDPHVSTLARQEVEQEIDEAEHQYQEALHTDQRLRAEVDETCLVYMSPFVGDGALADVDDDRAVADILDEKGAPCGKSKILVRDSLRTLRESGEDKVDAMERVVYMRENKDDKINLETDNKTFELGLDWTLGASVAAAGGLLTTYGVASKTEKFLKGGTR